MAGPLALVGGAEFMDGNEEQDTLLAAACAGRPAYVIASAAARSNPAAAVDTAHQWFLRFDVNVNELRIRTAAEARDQATAALARDAGMIYLAGGDPGLVVRLLAGSPVWDAVVAAWRGGGAALAGSSAGAMAMCQWSLLREGWPVRSRRRWADALGLLPGCAAVPHFDTSGESWLESAQAARPADALLLGIDERSAAVFDQGSWRAMGPGSVTVIDDSQSAKFSAGATIRGLPIPNPASPTADGRSAPHGNSRSAP